MKSAKEDVGRPNTKQPMLHKLSQKRAPQVWPNTAMNVVHDVLDVLVDCGS